LLEALLRERFSTHPHIGDIRGRGLFFAVEFLEDRDHKQPFDSNLKIHERIKDHALSAGLAVYPSGGTNDGRVGDHALIASPYISQGRDIEDIVDRFEIAAGSMCRELT
jgi:adenosylmethionine-8-amino-7-oxononanoate aminotransferase